jgi:hypothetical protein
MLEAATVDAISTIMPLMAIEAMYPGKRLIQLFLDNARYHHAKLVQAWLARPECRINAEVGAATLTIPFAESNVSIQTRARVSRMSGKARHSDPHGSLYPTMSNARPTVSSTAFP